MPVSTTVRRTLSARKGASLYLVCGWGSGSRYGHFAPKGIGFGDCYLTHSTDVDTIDTSTIENRPILEPRGWSVK